MTVSVHVDTPRRDGEAPAAPSADGGPAGADDRAVRYVGTIVGESTSREFRLAVAHEAVREQDIVAVDAVLRAADREAAPEHLRVWAKVQRIERMNPLFPAESAHELADTRTDPFDTVLSLSREMVTAVCQVLGTEQLTAHAVNDDGPGDQDGDADNASHRSGRRLKKQRTLGHLRYPAQPATSAYRPGSEDVKRIVLGDLASNPRRGLDVAHLANRREVDVLVDGDAVVRRHLAILAMTGAGKSWAARRVIEQVAMRNYPVVIFDPHGDYTGLAEVPDLGRRVKLYYAKFPILDEDVDTAAQIVSGLSNEEMTPSQYAAFNTLFKAALALFEDRHLESGALRQALYAATKDPDIQEYELRRDLFGLMHLAAATHSIVGQRERKKVKSADAEKRSADANSEEQALRDMGFTALEKVDPKEADSYRVLRRQLRKAAFGLREMEHINRERAGRADPLPADRTKLVDYGQISVVSLAGYSEQFQATLYSLIAQQLFKARVRHRLPYAYLMVLEEAHNFVPSDAQHAAVRRSVATTKQIAQEGRKFGAGMILISQRPSRLDETTLAMCNSYIIMRMVNPTDQSFVRRVVESLGADEVQMLPDLDVGEAVLSGQFINFPVLVRMKEPTSRGEREEDRDAFQALDEERRKTRSDVSLAR